MNDTNRGPRWRIAALVTVVALGLLVGALAGSGVAEEHDQEVPLHGHMLVQRPVFGEVDGIPAALGFRKCVDLAAGRALPLNAHHDHIHTGSAGAALAMRAGHAVVPTAPLTPWANCAELAAALPILFED